MRKIEHEPVANVRESSNLTNVGAHCMRPNTKIYNKITSNAPTSNIQHPTSNVAITLIALIITIIILLILAGVTLNMVMGDSGIFSKAQWAKFVTNFNNEQEAVELYAMQTKLEERGNISEVASTEKIITVNGEEKEIYPIKEAKIENSNLEEDLIQTIETVEKITDITEENTEIYEVDNSLINVDTKEEYIVNVKSGKIYLKEAFKHNGVNYYRPEYGINKNNEVVEVKPTIEMKDITIKVEKTATIQAKKDGSSIANSEIEFTSSDDKIATVDENGVVTGISKGEATITGKLKLDNEVTATCKIIVEEKIYATTDYVQEGLVVLYDGDYNTRDSGHDSSATTWENLVEDENNGTLKNVDFTDESGWTENSLILDGVNDWIAMGYLYYENMTVEICAKPLDVSVGKKQYYVSNFQTGGIGIEKDTTDKQCGQAYISKYYQNYSNNDVKINQIYSMSTGYNGTNLYYSENGEVNNQAISGKLGKPDSSTIFAIGTNPNGTSEELVSGEARFNIKVYSVRIYNRCLTEEEISKNYNVDKKRFNIQNVEVEATPNYVNDGLVCLLDASKNTKYGHSPRTKTWQNLTGTTNAVLKNVDNTAASGWGTNYLTLDGVNDWVNVGKNHYSTMTIEIVAEPLTIVSGKAQYYLANIESGGIAICKDKTGGYNFGTAYISKSYRKLFSNNIAQTNKIYSMSTGFDGSYLYFRENEDTYSSTDYSGSITNPSTTFALGTNPNGTSDDLSSNAARFNMKVYSVRIYNRCLTNEEIQHNYEIDKTRFGIIE